MLDKGLAIVMNEFRLGKIVATKKAVERFGWKFIKRCIQRHASGDWGNVSLETKWENDHADEGPDTIFSVYTNERGALWIVTEWDRSATTALLPEEY